MQKLEYYLRKAISAGGSDLFVAAGAPVSVKIGADLEPMDNERLSQYDSHELVYQAYQLAGREMVNVTADGDDDFAFSIEGLARIRMNAYKQRGSVAAVMRVVAFEIPDWKSLGIPQGVMDLARLHSGLVIVTGPAGSGKSTTQACIIDRINKTRKCHVVALEDPIEYLHRNVKAIVSQREIALDTESYAAALRSCLRQAPDVIYLGEMRDPETIRTAMTAAETGHLVFGTLHTKGAANTVDRIIDAFPPDQQQQARAQLAMVLDTVIFQQLVPVRPMPVAAFEIMKANVGIRSLIRDAKTHQIDAAIASGGKDCMVQMDRALAMLVKEKKAAVDVAEPYASNVDQFRRFAGLSDGGGLL